MYRKKKMKQSASFKKKSEKERKASLMEHH